jgi:hypothetical protein
VDRRRLPAGQADGEGAPVTATPSPVAALTEGEGRRDAALRLLRDRRAVLVRRVQRAYLAQLLDRGPSTVDAVRAAVPIPAGIDPRCVGAAVRGLATLRLIRRAGPDRSRRPVAHARDLPRWEIADRDAAAAWLAEHPDLPAPDAGEPVQRMLWH